MQESFDEIKKIKEKSDLLIDKAVENSNVFRRIAWHLSKPTVFKPLLILSVLFILQQFTGIYTFQFHAINMLKVLYIDILISFLLFINIYTFFFFFKYLRKL